MSWLSKETATPLDTTPIPGLHQLHGEVLARRYRQEWVKAQKYPLVTFPSGISRELWWTDDLRQEAYIHIFGRLSLPYRFNAGSAYVLAAQFASDLDLQVFHHFDDELIIMNAEGNRGYQVVYDNAALRLTDIIPTPGWVSELLDGESRAVLPPLYSGEKQGMNAIAPVKFFTPDSNWTWYPTEYDGNDVFFGLVSGFEVELGYFSLSELESVRGPLRLPIERDLDFVPTPLKVLKQQHQS